MIPVVVIPLLLLALCVSAMGAHTLDDVPQLFDVVGSSLPRKLSRGLHQFGNAYGVPWDYSNDYAECRPASDYTACGARRFACCNGRSICTGINTPFKCKAWTEGACCPRG